MTKVCKLFLIVFLFSLLGFSQISQVHYIPPLTTNEAPQGGSSWPEEQYIYLSTPSAENVTVTITPLNGNSITTYTDLNNGNPRRYDIGGADNPGEFQTSELFVDHDDTGGNRTLNAGFLIEANCPIYVSVRYNAGAQAGALVSKGDASLGTHFRAGMMTMGTKLTENIHQTSLSFISVMATQNDTKVRFDLPNATGQTEIENYNYTGPFIKTLNQYESVIIAIDFEQNQNSGSTRNSLIGALVRSVDDSGTLIVEDNTKPIVVNGSH